MMKGRDDDEGRSLPGFRFHPTDEELVGFYLRRKVENKTMKIDHIIQQIDIYKHDPWDLPKTMEEQDTKELYFFCKRGRKYRNSIRPNRVTGSGFWKATGIDKQVWSSGGVSIGLKKTLVYYRGSAGKGAKTDWMMHEFRLPYTNSDKCTTLEAEVWTVCRIIKRNLPHKKYVADWRKPSSNQVPCEYKPPRTTTATILEAGHLPRHDCYINFSSDPTIHYYNDSDNHSYNNMASNGQSGFLNHSPSVGQEAPSETTTSSSTDFITTEMEQFQNWDQLGHAVEFAMW